MPSSNNVETMFVQHWIDSLVGFPMGFNNDLSGLEVKAFFDDVFSFSLLLIIVMSMFELLLVFHFATTLAFAMFLWCENHSYL
jgi:hypothetical protein